MVVARVPSNVGAPRGTQMLRIGELPAEALQSARWLLAQDLRFEHMKDRELEEATWEFVCLANFQRDRDHVDEFVAKHAREPVELMCYFPVELLTITSEIDAYGVIFLPAEGDHIPTAFFGPGPRPTTGSVIAVECSGTDRTKMRRRSHHVAEHALRLLRAGLREHNAIPDRQLRFQLGISFWFSRDLTGFQTKDDEGWELELTDEMVELATSLPIATLPAEASTDVERRANRSLEWWERAQLAIEPVVTMLYLFFALEAILGDTSEGEKAEGLAMRRAVLGHRTTGSFSHPGRIYMLYAEVRSAAVHGEDPPDLPKREFDGFVWDVRVAINEFLDFARSKGLTKRKQIREALEADPDAAQILQRFLREEPAPSGPETAC